MSLKIQTALFQVRRSLTELELYKGKLARIVGKPFATRLDKAYPRSELGRRWLTRAIDMSNNAEIMGYAKANVNGKSLRGIYFQATDGSAKGVAQQAAVDVYRAKQIGPDVFFAHDSRIGTRILPEDLEGSQAEARDTKPLPPLYKWPIKVAKGKTTYTLKDCKVIEVAEPPGSGLYEYELFYKGKSVGKFNSQREVISRAQALRGS